MCRYDVVEGCWQRQPSLRPSFPELVEALDVLMTEATDYLHLHNFDPEDYVILLPKSSEERL